MRHLFQRVCRPMATEQTKGAFRFGLRLMAIDGTTEDVPDTEANLSMFGRHSSARGPSAFPQLQGQLIDLLHEVFGNPFSPARVDPAWLSSDVVALARIAYDGPAFDHLPILADALEDAGCTDAAILDHCRGPGPHVRGCWVVDLLLGKQ